MPASNRLSSTRPAETGRGRSATPGPRRPYRRRAPRLARRAALALVVLVLVAPWASARTVIQNKGSDSLAIAETMTVAFWMRADNADQTAHWNGPLGKISDPRADGGFPRKNTPIVTIHHGLLCA